MDNKRSMTSDAILHSATNERRSVLVWSWPEPTTMLSSAAVGGGLKSVDHLLNVSVPVDYGRTDLDVHLAEIVDELSLSGTHAGLFTAVDVTHVRRNVCNGVVADATVGASKLTWAADPSGSFTVWSPGTINIVVQSPVALSEAAAVNAVMTITEAKVQALIDCEVPGTGTASDAVALAWPTQGQPQQFGGPRSEWGARIAQSTYESVKAGLADFIKRHAEQ